LQYESRYFESKHGDLPFGFRDYSDHTPLIPHGTAVPLRVFVADPSGHLASASISLTHYGLATATYPQDFYRRSNIGPIPLGHRPLATGTYTIETASGTQLACSGAFVRDS
jgi:hypothetical protein